MGAEKKWFFSVLSLTFLSVLLLVLYSISTFSSPRPFPSLVRHGVPYPPAFGYYIFGGKGDKDRVFRLLLAIYHPRNRYVLHLGADASDDERYNLVVALKSVPAIRNFANVDVIGKPDRFSYMGSSYIAATLHAAALLMKLDRGWDWFISLSALDYPLITQDGQIPTGNSGSVMPDLIFSMFEFLGGTSISLITPVTWGGKSSPWVVLSRSFLEFCIFGWDNLPRTLLMYFNNVMLSEESYFQSVICNSLEFKNTTVNGDLRYMIWDNPPKMEPHYLNISDYGQMVQSGAAFARMFRDNDPVLDMVDEKILKRGQKRAASGPWCTAQNSWWSDPCSQWGDVNVVKPGPQAKKFGETVTNLLDDWNSQSNQSIHVDITPKDLSFQHHEKNPEVPKLQQGSATICTLLSSHPGSSADELLENGSIEVSPSIVAEVLKRLSNAGVIALSFFTWAEKQKEFKYDTESYNALIEALAFERMEEFGFKLEASDFNRLIDVLCWGKEHNLLRLDDVYREMKGEGFEPDVVTYGILIGAYCSEKRLSEALEFFERFKSCGFTPDAPTYNSLVGAYCYSMRIDDAFRVIDEMRTNLAARMFCNEDKVNIAMQVWDQMKAKGVLPGMHMFLDLVTGLCHEKKLDEVCKYFNEMLDAAEGNSISCWRPEVRECWMYSGALLDAISSCHCNRMSAVCSVPFAIRMLQVLNLQHRAKPVDRADPIHVPDGRRPRAACRGDDPGSISEFFAVYFFANMFWRMVGLSTASPVETILDKENFTLQELLDEDEIIQEYKALNA
ncbi:xylosyltransferase 1-like isoform X2 [Hibiscus syriacus]|uniref:Xylosyltransferase 1-like isoform X2 n=1 Tax=Hibiscus syriacus TaxID=106335 RepID=A0A6A3BRU6_HIBSY|nr:xylosyltransferase 1-like isoform X2 [Hibiscus syriacus]